MDGEGRHQIVDVRSSEIENSSCRGDVPALALERVLQQTPLEMPGRILKTGGRQLAAFAARRGEREEVSALHSSRTLAVRANDAAAHHVRELAHVSGPFGILERDQPARRELEGWQAHALVRDLAKSGRQ